MWKSSFQLYAAIYIFIHLACAGQQSCTVLSALPEDVTNDEVALLTRQQEATAIWAQAYAEKDVDTMMSYVRTDYIQHNPNIKSGREIAQQYITKRLASPGLVNNVTLVVSQLNFVLLHIHRIQPGEKDRAMADIYRLDGTCIAEHWDVQQEMGSNNSNPRAFF